MEDRKQPIGIHHKALPGQEEAVEREQENVQLFEAVMTYKMTF